MTDIVCVEVVRYRSVEESELRESGLTVVWLMWVKKMQRMRRHSGGEIGRMGGKRKK